MSVNTQGSLEFVRGDDVYIPVTIKVKATDTPIDYTKFEWQTTFRYTKNSPLFFPGVVSIEAETNRLILTWPKTSTKVMAGSGVVDLQSVKKDDQSERTWFIAKVDFVEDVTYVR
jgi:hypothetical protein